MDNACWVVMPVVNGRDLTVAALSDLLNQSVPTRILVVGQGWDPDLRREVEQIAEAEPERVFVWSHTPSLPSLSATWNTALRFCWSTGAFEALVVNNDLRVAPTTVARLQYAMQLHKALFVTAVGVTEEQFKAYDDQEVIRQAAAGSHGGPDFSCFLIAKAGHDKYPFDEGFVPLYGEDCDTHRRYMLGGDGDKIFSINLPFHHIGHGSQTLKAMDPTAREALERRIAGSREYYARKWGPINQERLTIPFDESSAQDNVTNPDLQRAILQPGN